MREEDAEIGRAAAEASTQTLLDRLNALEREIHQSRPKRPVATLILGGLIALLALDYALEGNVVWALATLGVVLAVRLGAPWLRVRRLRRERERLVEGLERDSRSGDAGERHRRG
jgi:hypothetical protein